MGKLSNYVQYFGSNIVEGVAESWVETEMSWMEVDGGEWRWVHGLVIPILLWYLLNMSSLCMGSISWCCFMVRCSSALLMFHYPVVFLLVCQNSVVCSASVPVFRCSVFRSSMFRCSWFYSKPWMVGWWSVGWWSVDLIKPLSFFKFHCAFYYQFVLKNKESSINKISRGVFRTQSSR